MSENEGWSSADIAAILMTRDSDREQAEPAFSSLPIEPSGGYHPPEDNYVVDPDYFEMLGMTDPEELIRRKSDISR